MLEAVTVVAMVAMDDRPSRASELFNHEHYLWAALVGFVLASAWYLFLTFAKNRKTAPSGSSGFRYLVVATFVLMFLSLALLLLRRFR